MTKPNPRNRLYRALSAAFIIIAVAYFLVFAMANVPTFPKLTWNLENFIWFFGAVTLYTSLYVIAGVAWELLLRDCGENIRITDAIIIVCISQFAKYIPGNIGHHVGRVALARSYSLNIARTIFTITLEASGVIVAGAVLALIALLEVWQDASNAFPQLPSVWNIIALTAAAGLVPVAGAWFINKLRPGPLKRLIGKESISIPSPRVLIICFLLYLLAYVLMGYIIDITAQGPFDFAQSYAWLLAGIYSIAWIAGFITPGAPAGLGVREAILVTALGPIYGGSVAAGLAIVLRVITSIGDIVAFVVALIARKWLLSTSGKQN